MTLPSSGHYSFYPQHPEMAAVLKRTPDNNIVSLRSFGDAFGGGDKTQFSLPSHSLHPPSLLHLCLISLNYHPLHSTTYCICHCQIFLTVQFFIGRTTHSSLKWHINRVIPEFNLSWNFTGVADMRMRSP